MNMQIKVTHKYFVVPAEVDGQSYVIEKDDEMLVKQVRRYGPIDDEMIGELLYRIEEGSKNVIRRAFEEIVKVDASLIDSSK
ncbi:hypothetical protein [Bacillus sp. 03113]|uniref:hypothetical protein n=1 Tax=Bacillus sp. 03113 TaxID=2578211 RepID=UPI0015E8C002|nr:hypothetical protein [Bacillus sp. 03113]